MEVYVVEIRCETTYDLLRYTLFDSREKADKNRNEWESTYSGVIIVVRQRQVN